MRQLTALVAIAAAGILLAGCSHDDGGAGASSSNTSSTTAASKTPLEKAQLPDLMLSSSDIDTLLGVTGTTSDPPKTALEEDTARRTDYTLPAECKYALHAALTPVYADSGYTAVYGYHDLAPTPPGADDLESPDVYQFVVLFPAPDQANAFFTASSQQWPACANRLDTVPADGSHPELQWKVGPITNTNGMLSTTVTLTFSRNGVNVSIPCQRALTVRSNVIVDVDACRKDAGDLGVRIANQIAGKIGKQ
ncbi:sensor domain-containing protein [Mycobacterium scrofulaceum]|uniref:Nuclease PIN n=1 Tax=Mycobacterium scrofulaceum TaxID=1783 RepID=A0A1A2VK15_MYCSC|nr:sensor domain-containing protein [Mycobacterium scrofulaceum]OBI01012.1 nuclease PIN [Mycobacterium scrofulaceum]